MYDKMAVQIGYCAANLSGKVGSFLRLQSLFELYFRLVQILEKILICCELGDEIDVLFVPEEAVKFCQVGVVSE